MPMVPSIHLNGTSREELLRQLIDGGHAVRKALEALGKAAPNGRDYYVQTDASTFEGYRSAYDKARAEHDARLVKLREVYSDLEAISMAIDE